MPINTPINQSPALYSPAKKTILLQFAAHWIFRPVNAGKIVLVGISSHSLPATPAAKKLELPSVQPGARNQDDEVPDAKSMLSCNSILHSCFSNPNPTPHLPGSPAIVRQVSSILVPIVFSLTSSREPQADFCGWSSDFCGWSSDSVQELFDCSPSRTL